MRRETRRSSQRSTEQVDQRDDDPRSPRIQHLSPGAANRFEPQVCPTCGQKIDPNHHDHSDPDRFTQETEAVGVANRVGPAMWFTVALLSIFAAALFIGWRDSPESDSASEDQLPVPDIDPNDGAASITGDDPEGDDATVSASRSTDAPRKLASLIGRHRISYVAEDGIAIVTPDSVLDPVRILTPGHVGMDDLLTGFGSFIMFDEQGHTYGFKRDGSSTTQRVYILFTQGQVIVGENSSFALAVGSVDTAEHIYVGNSSGLFMSRIEVPVGSELLNVPSLGVLLVSSTGETFVTSQSGFVHYSDWPVIAANASHHVEIRCGEPLTCTPVLVDRASGTGSDLPTEFAGDSGNVTIAPSGNHLLLISEDTTPSEPDLLYEVASEQAVALTEQVANTVAWSPDSTVAAWFDPTTAEPRLWVLNVATARIDSVNLADLDAPARTGTALIFLPA